MSKDKRLESKSGGKEPGDKRFEIESKDKESRAEKFEIERSEMKRFDGGGK